MRRRPDQLAERYLDTLEEDYLGRGRDHYGVPHGGRMKKSRYRVSGSSAGGELLVRPLGFRQGVLLEAAGLSGDAHAPRESAGGAPERLVPGRPAWFDDLRVQRNGAADPRDPCLHRPVLGIIACTALLIRFRKRDTGSPDTLRRRVRDNAKVGLSLSVAGLLISPYVVHTLVAILHLTGDA